MKKTEHSRFTTHGWMIDTLELRTIELHIYAIVYSSPNKMLDMDYVFSWLIPKGAVGVGYYKGILNAIVRLIQKDCFRKTDEGIFIDEKLLLSLNIQI